MKELFLLRGLPGAGKSTLAKSLRGTHLEADSFFMVNGEYKFRPEFIKYIDRLEHIWQQGVKNLLFLKSWKLISPDFLNEKKIYWQI